MVKRIDKKGKELYICEACKMIYLEKRIAKECEDFCKKNKSCNLEIIKHAVKF